MSTEASKPESAAPRGIPKWFFVATIIGTAVATFLAAALLVNIFQRKQEAKNPYVRVVEVDEVTTDPAKWGANWSREYKAYLQTVDPTHTRYGGSEGTPTKSRLEKDPWLVRAFAGYAFSIDFRERRGHAFMLADQEMTRRVLDKPQPGACLHCHASIIPTYRRVGLAAMGTPDVPLTDFNWPAVMKGFEQFSKMSYTDAHAELLKTPDGTPNEPTPANVAGSAAAPPTTKEALAAHVGQAHPVSCVDCHDPKSMQLRVTRPGFVVGIAKLAASDEPTPHLPSIERWRKGSRKEPYNPNVEASRQEMRSFACGQCHVEYYCGPKETLFFPWEKGLKVEQVESTYDNHKFADGHRFFDFKHTETGAEVLKAQHPEFEMWSQGVHARSGVACADCHMPYTREGAVKISDHWVRSPLLNIARSCQVCHPYPESELQARVDAIQDRTHTLMQRSGASLIDMLDAVKAAKTAGATDAQLADVFALQRKAQWRLDFVNAENSMGFHAPAEAARILGESIDYFRQAQLKADQLRGGRAPATQPTASAN